MHGLYRSNPRCLVTLFDLRCSGAEGRLRRKLASWCGFAHAERLTADRVAFVMRTGEALGSSK